MTARDEVGKAYHNRDWIAAEVAYAQASAKDLDDPRLWTLGIEIAARSRNLPLVAQRLEGAIAKFPQDPRFFLQAINIYRSENALKEGVALAQKAFEQFPGNQKVLRGLFPLFFKAEEYEGVIAVYERLQTLPEVSWTAENFGYAVRAALVTGRFSRVIGIADDFQKKFPAHPDVFNMGDSLIAAGYYPQGVALFNKYLGLLLEMVEQKITSNYKLPEFISRGLRHFSAFARHGIGTEEFQAALMRAEGLEGGKRYKRFELQPGRLRRGPMDEFAMRRAAFEEAWEGQVGSVARSKFWKALEEGKIVRPVDNTATSVGKLARRGDADYGRGVM